MKRTITIERPNDNIPGLITVNSYLAERFGVTVATVLDEDDKGNLKYVGTQLRKAHIEGDDIIVGEVLVDGK